MLSISVLGTEVFSIALGPQLYAEDPEGWNGSTHTNGSFERDTEPLSATNEEPYSEDRKIGFGRW